MTSFGFPYKFNKDVASIIATFLTPVHNKFCDWVKPDKLKWSIIVGWLDETMLEQYVEKIKRKNCLDFVCQNENAIQFIEKHMDRTSRLAWVYLASNKNATHLFDLGFPYFCSLCFHAIALNPNGAQFLMKHIDKYYQSERIVPLLTVCENPNPEAHFVLDYVGVDNFNDKWWNYLCKNENAIAALERFTQNFTTNLDKIHWKELSTNKNAIHILEQFPDMIDLNSLAFNENGIELLNKFINNKSTIEIESGIWQGLCSNVNGIPTLEKLTNNFTEHLNKLDWILLSRNPSAVPLLKQYIDKINLRNLCKNENAAKLVGEIFDKNPEKFDAECFTNICITFDYTVISKLEHRIRWDILSWNKTIVEIDVAKFSYLKQKCTNFIRQC